MATLPPAHIDTLHARHESKSVIIHPNRNRSEIEIRHAKSAEFYSRKGKRRGLKKVTIVPFRG
jgi:hypothetical protein